MRSQPEHVLHDLVIFGTPVSQQSKKPESKERWQRQVQEAARLVVAEEDRLERADLAGALIDYHFGHTEVDLDNIAKPILDALTSIIYDDDRRIVALSLRKTDLRGLRLQDPPPRLAHAIIEATAREDEFVYVRFTDKPVDHTILP
jgi:hypothetical protein